MTHFSFPSQLLKAQLRKREFHDGDFAVSGYVHSV